MDPIFFVVFLLLISDTHAQILVFAAIILHICCGNDAQNIKSHTIVDNNRYDGPSSPVFFHRQRKLISNFEKKISITKPFLHQNKKEP